jgi:hypothetical protein
MCGCGGKQNTEDTHTRTHAERSGREKKKKSRLQKKKKKTRKTKEPELLFFSRFSSLRCVEIPSPLQNGGRSSIIIIITIIDSREKKRRRDPTGRGRRA